MESANTGINLAYLIISMKASKVEKASGASGVEGQETGLQCRLMGTSGEHFKERMAPSFKCHRRVGEDGADKRPLELRLGKSEQTLGRTALVQQGCRGRQRHQMGKLKQQVQTALGGSLGETKVRGSMA